MGGNFPLMSLLPGFSGNFIEELESGFVVVFGGLSLPFSSARTRTTKFDY